MCEIAHRDLCDAPTDPAQRELVACAEGDFSLYVRAYWPKPALTDGSWTPPAVQF
jgi:hypothetical protein